MSSFIPKDFEPDENTMDMLRKKGIFADFVEYVKPNFLLYWGDLKSQKLAKGKKQAWQQTFYVWATRAFQGKAGREFEENKHRRESHSKAYKGDFFADALDRLDPTPKVVPTTTDAAPKYHKPQPRPVAPGGEPMSAEQAFDQLKKMGIL